MTENWYILLELEFAPNPVKDESVIKEAIDKKIKFWSMKANDFQHGAEYRKYLDYAKKGVIDKDMIGPSNIRDELIMDAQDRLYGPIDKLLKTSKLTEFKTETIEKIVKRLKKDGVTKIMVVDRIKALGYKIIESDDSKVQEIYKKYYKDKPNGSDMYMQYDGDLSTFKCETLYDFINTIDPIKKIEIEASANLIARAKKKNEEYSKTATAESGTGQKLCAICMTVFSSEQTKKQYDDFLVFKRRVEILNDFKDSYDLVGDVDDAVIKDTINRLTSVTKNRALSEEILIAFCKCEKIHIGEIEENPNLKVCRCGFTNDTSDGRKKCAHCGLDLVIICPKCGKENDNTVNVCRCGFKLDNVDRVENFCELAEQNIERMNLDVAKANLSDAEKLWPGYDKIRLVKSKLDDVEKRVGASVRELKSACSEHKYYTARKLYANIQNYFPNYNDIEIDSEINTAINQAEHFKKTANAATNELEVIDACTKAFAACSDCIGIKELIAKYPPKSPINIKASVDEESNSNVISWEMTETIGTVFYYVVHKEGAVPISIEDGTLVAKVSMNSCIDKKIKAGAKYFYSVFAERAGIFSKALQTKEPIVNCFDITDVDVLADNGKVQITWGLIEDIAKVKIERTLNNETKKLECFSRNKFLDESLVNDVEYKYRVFLEYNISGQIHETKGKIVFATPTTPPKCVDSIKVKLINDGEYELIWSGDENDNVKFFFSYSKPDLNYGEMVSISKLQSDFEALMINKTGPNTGKFIHKNDTPIYIIPVIEKSGSCVIGDMGRTNSAGSIKIKSVNLVNGKILIVVDAPKDYSRLLVLYRPDRFAEDVAETNGTVRKIVSKKQYEYDGGIYIDSSEKRNYYLSVFAEFRVDGELDYSSGTEYLFSNSEKTVINYSVSVSGGMLRQKSVLIDFNAEGSKKFNLPAIDIMYQKDRVPMFKKSSDPFYHIEAKSEVSHYQERIPIPKNIGKSVYIKAFIANDKDADGYQLKLDPKSDLKII